MKVQVEIEPLLLRGGEVADLLGCSRALAFRWMQKGILPTLRVPGARSVRVPRAALVKWIEEQTKAAESPAEGERVSTSTLARKCSKH